MLKTFISPSSLEYIAAFEAEVLVSSANIFKKHRSLTIY
jgi:hypothetical protein